jgi:hypothetical protein
MFDLKQANEWLKASKLGEWKVYPRNTSDEAANELGKVAKKQTRGQSPFVKTSAADVRAKNDTYVFFGPDGTPVVYVIAFWDSDRVCLNNIYGRESSGTVEEQFIQAVKALTEGDKDFQMKVADSAKQKVLNMEKQTEEEKVFTQTFLPPTYSTKAIEGLIGGGGAGGGFMQSAMANMRSARIAKVGDPLQVPDDQQQNQQQNQQQQQRQNPNNQPDPNDPNNPQPPNTQQQDDQQIDPTIVNQMSLIALVQNDLEFNADTLAQIMESIEKNIAVDTGQGLAVAVALEMKQSTFDRIEEYLNHPQNKGCGIKRGKNYIALRDKIKAETEAAKVDTEEEPEPKPKPKKPQKEEQETETEATHEKDIAELQQTLENHVASTEISPPEPEQPSLEAKPKTNYKQFTYPTKKVTIKNGRQIHTK